ncbi:MAG TPA: N-acetylneuraminate synthase [Magnetovibrio sp.]
MAPQPHRTFIIAEAGVNHNGSLERALAMVDAAAKAGADAVKFQTFSADRLVTQSAPKAAYQKASGAKDETQHAMLQALELAHADHVALQQRAMDCGIEFLSSPFDEVSADMLAALGVKAIKLGSGEVTNIPLLRHVARLNRAVILSTGMSTLEEVAAAMKALDGASVTLLHCVTSYPAPVESSNLRAMETLRAAFNVPVGWSDHSTGITIPTAAVAMGACMIEKHFTLDRTLPGPDHAASLEPDELAQMVKAIREVELALGDGEKKPADCELEIRDVARKSIVSSRAIAAGETLTLDMIDFRRPGTGMSPALVDSVIGRTATQEIAPSTLLLPEMFS